MKTKLPGLASLLTTVLLLWAITGHTQPSLRSLVINHGANSCGSSSPQQQMIAGAMTATPSLVYSGANGVPYYNVYTAYNPKDKQIYFADIHGGITQVYAMDYNLTGVIQNPPTTTPTYTYPFQIDQFCFDKNGNNIAIYNYNAGGAVGRVKSMDLATGADVPGTDKQLDFPAGLQPNSLGWGDIVFMPNGRIFMTFGNSPSRLYELVNFEGPGNATAVYLTDIPRPCYSIGYVDGNLIVAGSDGGGCYFFKWDITAQSLSPASPFPLGMNTADMTHMNVGVGVSEELASSSLVSAGSADLEYQVVIKNKGNISLFNTQFQNNLATTFGAGNISNLQVDFISNPAGLVLNPGFDGESDLDMLQPGHFIDNFPVAADSVIIRIRLRAANLIPGFTYLNSTIATGHVGAGANQMDVRDSSNNGDYSRIDIDNNGMSDDPGEGIPTPYQYLLLLPYSGFHSSAAIDHGAVTVRWETSQESHMDHYEIERSTDGRNFMFAGSVQAKNNLTNSYLFNDPVHPATAITYYRIRILDTDGHIQYGPVMAVNTGNDISASVSVFPNPFTTRLQVRLKLSSATEIQVRITDAAGKTVRQLHQLLHAGISDIGIEGLGDLSRGVYFLQWKTKDDQGILKLIR